MIMPTGHANTSGATDPTLGSANQRKAGSGMHGDREAEVFRVEPDRRVDIIDDVANADTAHRVFLP